MCFCMKPKRLLFKPVLFFITLVAILVLPAMAMTGDHWDTMTVEKESPTYGSTGLYTSIVMDKNDVPHASWVNEARSQVEYGTYDTKTDMWTIERVGPIDPKQATQTTSIDIDPQGNPAISYQGIDGHLYFAHRENGVWNIKDIYATGGSTWSSLKYAPNGQPYIALADGTWKNHQLTWAWQKDDGSGWDFKAIDNSYDAGYAPSLDFDSKNRATIAYQTGYDDNRDHKREYLKIARQRDNGTWEIVSSKLGCDDGFECGIRPSLAVDSRGNAHFIEGVSYGNNNTLRYGVLNRSDIDLSVNKEIIRWSADQGPAENWGSLALDLSDKFHIVYIDPINHSLVSQYGLKWDRDAGYSRDTVDLGDVGRCNAVAADSEGNPGIIYPDVTNNSVRIARWIPKTVVNGSWKITTVATGGGGQTSIALDRAKNPRISYYNATDLTLKYAARDRHANWSIETVADGGQGQYASLALDSSGNPSISYYDAPGHMVNYARRTGPDIWERSTVEDNVDLGGDGGITSLALDSSGMARVAYYDTKSQRMHYATAARRSGIWSVEQVDTVKVGQCPSLALHSNNIPAISYLSEESEIVRHRLITITKLKYVDKSSGQWKTNEYSTVAQGPTSLDLNANIMGGERAEIAYISNSPADNQQILNYMEIDPPSGSSWKSVVDERQDVEQYSLALSIKAVSLRHGPPGHTAIAYYYEKAAFAKSPDKNGLNLARMSWGNWKTGAVVTNAGEYPSLALDPAGHPFISYYDRQNNTVNLAEWVEN
jgi:hypothetical protein